MQTLIRKLIPRSLRNWIRTPRRSAQYIWDRIQFQRGRVETVSVRNDWTPSCHPAATSHFEVFRSDPVQSEELDTFIRECPPGIQLLDIGAHYGFFALAAVHYGGPSARVLCVEASPNAASILNSTIALNPGKDQIEVFNVAMGDRDGTLPMLATGPIAGDYFVVPTEERSDTTLVPQRSLASLLKETRFKPTHIKIDIEGFEFEVVESSIATLKEIRPVLFFELHGDALRARGKDPSAVIGMLQSAGYNRFEMAGHPIQLEEMKAAAFNCRMTCISSS